MITGPRQVGNTTLLYYLSNKSIISSKDTEFIRIHEYPLIIDEFQYIWIISIFYKRNE